MVKTRISIKGCASASETFIRFAPPFSCLQNCAPLFEPEGGHDEERDRSESGCPAKGTQREAQVAPSIFDPEEGPIPQNALMRRAKISGAQTSLASRFQRRKATRGIRVLFMSQVRLDFLGPILVFLRAMREAM